MYQTLAEISENANLERNEIFELQFIDKANAIDYNFKKAKLDLEGKKIKVTKINKSHFYDKEKFEKIRLLTFFRTSELATLFGYSKGQINNLIKKGVLKGGKLNKNLAKSPNVVYYKDALNYYLAQY